MASEKNLYGQIKKTHIYRLAPDISRYRNALRIAEALDYPDRKHLYDCYREARLDPHLLSVTRRIKLKCTNSKIKFIKDNGEFDEEHPINKLTSTTHFSKVVKWIVEAMFWGHSLVEVEIKDGVLVDSVLIPRDNVRPDFEDVTPEYGMFDKGIKYTEIPYENFTFEARGDEEFGLFLAAVPATILKRYGVMDWSELLEMFGIPLISATYDPNDAQAKKQAEESLNTRGGAAAILLPDGSTVNVHQGANASSSEMFKANADFHNKEMSKLFLFQTMTTEGGQSHAQAKVHEGGEDEAIMAYKMFVEQHLNGAFKKILEKHGFDTKGKFQYDDVQTIVKTAGIIAALRKAGISKKYIEDRFGIPLEEEKAANIQEPGEKGDEKKKSNLNLPEYVDFCGHKHEDSRTLSEDDLEAWEKELIQQIWDNKGSKLSHIYYSKLTDKLTKGIEKGFGKGKMDYDSPDYTAKRFLEMNVHHFSAAKDMALVQQMNQIRQGVDTFKDFEDQVQYLMVEYNRTWLKTEYDMTVAVAQNASKYQNQVATKDLLPYWEYRTVGDKRVRAAHEKLDGMIFKADDDAFNELYAPNGWRCRCIIVARATKGGKKLSTLADAKNALGDEYTKMAEKGFNVNRGKMQQVFLKNNMYLDIKPNKLKAADYGLGKVDFKDLPKLAPKSKTKTEALEWFASKVGKNGLDDAAKVRLLDHLKRPVELVDVVLDTQDFSLVDFIEDVLTNPTEIWAKQSKESLFINAIKFYNNKAIIINKVAKKNGQTNIIGYTTIDKKDIEAFRNGLLLYIKE